MIFACFLSPLKIFLKSGLNLLLLSSSLGWGGSVRLGLFLRVFTRICVCFCVYLYIFVCICIFVCAYLYIFDCICILLYVLCVILHDFLCVFRLNGFIGDIQY